MLITRILSRCVKLQVSDKIEHISCFHQQQYDTFSPVKFVFSEEIYEGIRDAKLYVFEESNHVPYLEERDKFDRMVRDFGAYPKKECSGTNI